MRHSDDKTEIMAYLKTVLCGAGIGLIILIFFGVKALLERGGP